MLRTTGWWTAVVRDLPALLRAGDVLVANDTRVIPAQLTARRGAARIGITLDQPRPDGAWHALARNARRLHAGDELAFDGAADLRATVLERHDDGGSRAGIQSARRGLRRGTAARGRACVAALYRAARRTVCRKIARTTRPSLPNREGAVAAPTAGLHFTPALLAALDSRGIARVTVTLHVGAGTFLPVRTDDVLQHRMHAERGMITAAAAAAINAARVAGGRIVAVGTTSLRLLETAASENGQIGPFAGDTDLFILPGYRFRAVDVLMTNFHLPRSTLFMLVCAFAGTAADAPGVCSCDRTGGYRFYSYGDACLLERNDGA